MILLLLRIITILSQKNNFLEYFVAGAIVSVFSYDFFLFFFSRGLRQLFYIVGRYLKLIMLKLICF